MIYEEKVSEKDMKAVMKYFDEVDALLDDFLSELVVRNVSVEDAKEYIRCLKFYVIDYMLYVPNSNVGQIIDGEVMESYFEEFYSSIYEPNQVTCTRKDILDSLKLFADFLYKKECISERELEHFHKLMNLYYELWCDLDDDEEIRMHELEKRYIEWRTPFYEKLEEAEVEELMIQYYLNEIDQYFDLYVIGRCDQSIEEALDYELLNGYYRSFYIYNLCSTNANTLHENAMCIRKFYEVLVDIGYLEKDYLEKIDSILDQHLEEWILNYQMKEW